MPSLSCQGPPGLVDREGQTTRWREAAPRVGNPWQSWGSLACGRITPICAPPLGPCLPSVFYKDTSHWI